MTNHEGSVTAVVYSPNGRLAASGSDDCSILIWNVLDKIPFLTLTQEGMKQKKIDVFSGNHRRVALGEWIQDQEGEIGKRRQAIETERQRGSAHPPVDAEVIKKAEDECTAIEANLMNAKFWTVEVFDLGERRF